MKEPIEFTDRERFVLSYYRDPHLSSWSRHATMDGIYLGTSIFFVVLYLVQQDVAWGVIGYGILMWRLTWGVWRSRQFTEDLRSVIHKYDARYGSWWSRQPRSEESNGTAQPGGCRQRRDRIPVDNRRSLARRA